MKELELKVETKIEVSVNKKKQIEHELIGDIELYDGHTIWQINNQTLEVEKAKFSNATYHFAGDNRKEIIVKQGHTYVSALNKKNALRKFNQGRNGGKPIDKEPLKLHIY